MRTVFKGLFAVAFSLGFNCSAHSIPASAYSQSQRIYIASGNGVDGGPRAIVTLGGTSGATRLTNLDNSQIN